MNMQDFYQELAVKPSQPHRRRLKDLTQLSRAEVLNAANIEWFIWKAETSDL
jgi:hypothetical protein